MNMRLEDLMSGFRGLQNRFGGQPMQSQGAGRPALPPGLAMAMQRIGGAGGASPLAGPAGAMGGRPGWANAMAAGATGGAGMPMGGAGGQYQAGAPPAQAPAPPQVTIEDLYRMLAGGGAPAGAQTMSLGQRMPAGGMGGLAGMRPGGY